MKKNSHLLKALHSCTNRKDQKLMLRAARPELVKAICDCIVNVVYGKVPVSSQVKSKLRKKVKILKQLTDPKKTTIKKKNLLIQHGGGFLTSILGAIAKPILGILSDI